VCQIKTDEYILGTLGLDIKRKQRELSSTTGTTQMGFIWHGGRQLSGRVGETLEYPSSDLSYSE
jgi:hypothetical protein